MVHPIQFISVNSIMHTFCIRLLYTKQRQNVHRFALRAIKGEFLKREKERKKEKEKKRKKERERQV